VKKVRVFPRLIEQQKKRETNQPNTFVFCERTTGMAQFRAESNVDVDCTIERTAALLAMQCLVRGQNPSDFEIMMPADRSFASRLHARAEELLEQGRAVAGPASLSPRQREILNAVLCNHANKEIATRLNISVRTVKFHISSLLSKFGVENRAELARRAAGFLRPMLQELQTPYLLRSGAGGGSGDFKPEALGAPARNASKTRSVRFPGRVLTA
jgi:DNA-binding CsgD family transcriptional regulator